MAACAVSRVTPHACNASNAAASTPGMRSACAVWKAGSALRPPVGSRRRSSARPASPTSGRGAGAGAGSVAGVDTVVGSAAGRGAEEEEETEADEEEAEEEEEDDIVDDMVCATGPASGRRPGRPAATACIHNVTDAGSASFPHLPPSHHEQCNHGFMCVCSFSSFLFSF
jgi:hypothetical protein